LLASSHIANANLGAGAMFYAASGSSPAGGRKILDDEVTAASSQGAQATKPSSAAWSAPLTFAIAIRASFRQANLPLPTCEELP